MVLCPHAEFPIGAHHAGQPERLGEVLRNDGGAPALLHQILDAGGVIIELVHFAEGNREVVYDALVVGLIAVHAATSPSTRREMR